jgi:hypothetical protein
MGEMSSPTPPRNPLDGNPGDPGSMPEPTAPGPRRGSARVRPDADFDLMLALRGAARARDLRNRVVRPRSAETSRATGTGPEDPGTADRPRDLAHPN